MATHAQFSNKAHKYSAAEDTAFRMHLLCAHKSCRQLCQAEEAHKVISGQARDVQAGLEVLQDSCHDCAKASSLQQLLQVLPQLPQQLRLQLSRWSLLNL